MRVNKGKTDSNLKQRFGEARPADAVPASWQAQPYPATRAWPPGTAGRSGGVAFVTPSAARPIS
jgi:hypothetical protein